MDKRNKLIRWGMIGCGNVTLSKSAPAYQLTPGFALQAVASRRVHKATEYAELKGIPTVYATVEELLADEQLDAIYIATPPDSHCEYALEVAKHGKICCVEKPMALNDDECQRMLDAFERRNLPLFVAYYRRCLDGFRQIKALLRGGAIGQVLHVSWQYSRPPGDKEINGADNWRTQAEIAPGGYFDDIACHGLDLLCYFFGEVSEVSASARNRCGYYTAADSVSARWRHVSGVMAVASWQFCTPLRQDKVQVLGTEGWLEFSVFSDSPAWLYTQHQRQRIPMLKPEPIQLPFVKAMADHLSGLKPHPSLGKSAAHTNWIMRQIVAISD